MQPQQVVPVVRTLLGSIDTGDGGTPEQRGVIAAFVTGYWGRDDLDVDALDPLAPEAAAAALTEAAARRRVRELAVVLELCRHPLGEDQVALTDAYAAALGDRFIPRELPDNAANTDVSPFFAKHVRCPHSVVTQNLIDAAGQPTIAARDEILAFFATRLATKP